MADRLQKAYPILVGLFLPVLLIVTNTMWNYAGILLTIAAIVWLGFAVVLLAPKGTD